MSTPAVGLVQACDDPSLFGFPLWPGQRRLLEALEEALRAGDWLAIWCVGRRSGKSTLSALVALWCCLLRPDLDELAGATGRSYAVVVATNLKQARHVVQVAAEIVQRSPLLASMVERVSLDEIAFSNGTTLVAFPASSRGGRGRAVRCLILDEAAHLADNDSGAAHEAEEIYRALLPSVSQFNGRAPVIVSSTPAGDSNWFGQLVTAGLAGEVEHGRVHVAASADMNPTLDRGFLEGEERRDPDSYRGEFLAELLGSGGSFLDPEMVDNNVAGRGELDPADADAWVCGFDPSFSKDPAAVVLVGRDRANRDRLLVGCVRTWPPPKGRKLLRDDRRTLEDRLLSEVADVAQRYGARAVITDGYMPQVVNEALRRRGLIVESHTLTTASKVEMFAGVKARLTAGSLELYPEPTLLAELKRLRSTFRGGSRQIETPRLQGSHCDTAIALGLATWFLDRDGPPGRGNPIIAQIESIDPLAREWGRRLPTVAESMNRIF